MLVVDEDQDARTLVAEICRLQGHEVLEVTNGAEAIELGSSAAPDLLLVDWVLPDISGTEVIIERRRLRRKLSDVPLTGVTLEAIPGLGYRLAVKTV